jgi:serine/threonine protein kinase
VLKSPDQPPAPARGDAREVTVGDVLRGRYVIKNVIGLGGTGTVFEAIDRFRLDLPESGQRVAIKVLHSNAAGQSAVLTDLRREFQLLQSLSHPNIVRAHEYDRDGDTAFFTMEHLSGLSLESVLSAHREVVLSRAHALIIVRDVAAALEHAHSRGVVHGDLNPGNIFITNDGGIRVLDFGAAHTPSGTPTMEEPAFEGTAFATPRYASVQLLNGERADARDDTYSLACILYVLLAGKHPFGELNAAQARAQRVKARRPAGLTGKQWHALRAGLSFDRQRRPVDIAAWLEPFDPPKPEVHLPVLLALLKTSPRSTGRSGGIALLVAALAIVAIGWWATGHRDLVAQATGEAQSALTDLWQRARSAVAGSSSAPDHAQPVAEQEAAPPPPAAAAPEPTPVIPSSVEQSTNTSRAIRPKSQEPTSPVPATRTPPSRAAVPAAAASMTGDSSRTAAAQPAHTKIELTADTVEVPYSDPAAHVLVKRAGNLHDDTSFTWWTESGTAKPGQDFVAVKPHEEHFEDGKPLVNLFVPVVADSTRKQPRSFYIVINDPSEHASLGKRTLTMVTIVPAEIVSEAPAQ